LGEEADKIEEEKDELLRSKSEDDRRKQFDELLRLQQERNGIIEPKKDLVIQPGMYISLPTSQSTTTDGAEEEHEIGVADSTAGGSEQTNEVATSHNKQKNANVRRKHRMCGSRRQHHHHLRSQWVQKGAGNSSSTDP
jgi:E3 ubiquitin-protein ligase RNF25